MKKQILALSLLVGLGVSLDGLASAGVDAAGAAALRHRVVADGANPAPAPVPGAVKEGVRDPVEPVGVDANSQTNNGRQQPDN